MIDFLHPHMDEASLKQMSNLALAHVGDAVYEIMVRGLLATTGGLQTSRSLHSSTTRLVCASSQAEAALLIQPELSEQEQTVFRHGRNAKPKSVPKSATSAEYSLATALEALFGWLYLTQQYDRINALFALISASWHE